MSSSNSSIDKTNEEAQPNQEENTSGTNTPPSGNMGLDFLINGFDNLDIITDSVFKKMQEDPIVIIGVLIGVSLAGAAIAGTGGAGVAVAAAAVGMFTKFPFLASLGYAGVGAALNTIAGCILWAKTISVLASGELKNVLYDNHTPAQRKAILFAAVLIIVGSALTGAGVIPAVFGISFLLGGKVTLTGVGAGIAIQSLTLKAMATLGGAFIFGLIAKTVEQTRKALKESKTTEATNNQAIIWKIINNALSTIERGVAFITCVTTFTIGRCLVGGLAKCAATSAASAFTGLICLKYILKHAFTLPTHQDRNAKVGSDYKKAKGTAISIFETLHKPVDKFLEKEKNFRNSVLKNNVAKTTVADLTVKKSAACFRQSHTPNSIVFPRVHNVFS